MDQLEDRPQEATICARKMNLLQACCQDSSKALGPSQNPSYLLLLATLNWDQLGMWCESQCLMPDSVSSSFVAAVGTRTHFEGFKVSPAKDSALLKNRGKHTKELVASQGGANVVTATKDAYGIGSGFVYGLLLPFNGV